MQILVTNDDGRSVLLGITAAPASDVADAIELTCLVPAARTAPGGTGT